MLFDRRNPSMNRSGIHLALMCMEVIYFAKYLTRNNRRKLSKKNDWINFFLLIISIGLGVLFPLTGISTAGSAIPPVTLQLAWKHQFQFAGYYTALHKGFYESAGLQVTLSEGGEGRFAREAVLRGDAAYGIAGAELLLHRADGDPFVVLAPIFQHSPSVLMTRADAGISNIQQLSGKRVMMLPGKKDADILAAFLNENISLDQIIRLNQTYNLDDLIRGRTDALTVYLTNEPFYMQQLGIPIHLIHPSIYGVDFYSDCLFTTQEEVKRHPHRVEAFLSASIKGWEYAMAHPDEIIQLLIGTYGVKKSADHLRFEAEAIRGIMFPKLVEIGHMNPGRWRHIADTYAALEMLPQNYPLDGFIYTPPHLGKTDYGWMIWLVLILLLIMLLFSLVMLGLISFNRKLQREVNERKEAERAYKETRRELNTLIDNLPGIAFRCANDTHWSMRYISEGIQAITGYLPDEVIDNGVIAFNDLIHPEDRDRVWNHVQTALLHHTAYEIEYRMVTRADDVKTVLERGVGVFSGDNQLIAIEGFILDVTQRVEDEEEKLQLEAQLRQAQKMEAIGTLAAGIAHDFNNIVGIILGSTELISLESNESRDSLGRIQTACLRAKELVQQLLSFSKTSDPKRQPVAINAVVSDAVTLLRASIPSSITIRQHLPDRSPMILSDASRISQVVINLCTNAAHAMPHGGSLDITVTLTAPGQCLDLPGMTPSDMSLLESPHVLIQVKDTGEGIAPEYLDRIFDPYFTTKGPDKGSGFGLSVVHGIVTQQQGRIFVASGDGETLFSVCLPTTLAAASAPSSLSDVEIHETMKSEAQFSKSSGVSDSDTLPVQKQILLVDDEPDIIEVGTDMLTRCGYQVIAETSPMDAWHRFQQQPEGFDLLITDMTMPEMSGHELIEKIKTLRPELPAILCSGYLDSGVVSKIDDVSNKMDSHGGPVLFLPKPFNYQELIETVARMWRGDNAD